MDDAPQGELLGFEPQGRWVVMEGQAGSTRFWGWCHYSGGARFDEVRLTDRTGLNEVVVEVDLSKMVLGPVLFVVPDDGWEAHPQVADGPSTEVGLDLAVASMGPEAVLAKVLGDLGPDAAEAALERAVEKL
jgi:hypothetical protein